MASADERIATATATEEGTDKVKVTCLVDGLQVSGLINKTAKNGTVYVEFSDKGFDMTAVVKEKGKETTFRKQVKKLPGLISKKDCKWKAEKGKVVITLLKQGDDPWAVQLAQRGLEQESDEENE